MSARPGHNQPVIVEPRREVVEIVDPDGVNMIVVSEPVPTYTGRSPIETVGAQPNDILVVGGDGILRPAHLEQVVPAHQRGDKIHYVESLDAVPPGIQVGEYVTVISGPNYGEIYRVEET
jgi:hypothetical protein